MDGRWRVVLSFVFAFGLPMGALAEEELPEPPAAIEDASAGVELPPPPSDTSLSTPEATASENADLPAALPEEAPPVELAAPSEPPADTLVPADSGMEEAPPAVVRAPEPYHLRTSQEFDNLSVEDKLKSKDLVLWLSLGASYGTISTKGNYIPPAEGAVGGLGYAASLGLMAGSFMQVQADFTGTPLTDNSTVTNVMFGLGPRFGFIYGMAMIGVQQGPKLSDRGTNPPLTGLFAYGVKGGLDLVLGHGANSRVSYGISPEAFYTTTQGVNGYKNAGISLVFRLYGYENAF